jgi:hypothetical protein
MHEASRPNIPAVVAPFSTELGPAPHDAAYMRANELSYYVAEAVLDRLSWDKVAVIVQGSRVDGWREAIDDYWRSGATSPMTALAGLASRDAEVEAARIVTRTLITEYREGRITPFTCLWSIGLLYPLLEFPDVEILTEAWSGADEVRTNPALEEQARASIRVLLGRLEAWSTND